MKVIALDIGGTSIKSAIVADYKILTARKQPTRASEGIDAILASITSSIEILAVEIRGEYGIAISSAGDIDPYNGRVIYASDNLPNYTGLEIVKLLTDRFKVKVIVINDAMAAIMGEHAIGACKGADNCIMLTLGTGLGGAAIVNGKLLLGENCRGGRFGHVALRAGGRQCTCGRMGCLEQYVSATGLVRTAREYGITCKDSNDIAKQARDGNKAAAMALDIFATDLAQAISDYNDIFDPKSIVIGGGLVELSEAWWGRMSNHLRSDVSAKISRAALGNMAGIIGAYEYYIKAMLHN